MGLLADRYRIVIVLITFFCLTSICSNYVIINFTFICMKDDYSQTISIDNQTVSAYDYSPQTKSYLLWAVAVGTLIGTFPINYCYTVFGARIPFFLAGILSAICSILLPWTASLGLPYLIVLRFFQGLSYAADFAAIGLVCVKWAPLRETALFICILTGFSPFASTITNVATGRLCVSSLGWRWSYYIHGMACLVFFALWLVFYSDEPSKDKRVTEKELARIQKHKSEQHLQGTKEVPYMAIIRNPIVLLVWLNAFAEMSSMVLLTTYTPIYFHKVLGFSISSTGLLSSISIVAQLPVKVSAALFSDRIRYFSERTKMLFFNTVSVGLVGAIFGVVGFVSSPALSVVLLTLIHCFSSTNCGGFYKCGTLVSRQYAHVVIGTIQWMKCVALFTAPAIVSWFVTDEAQADQWQHVFLVLATGLLTVNFISYPLFTDQPAEFTLAKEKLTEVKLALEPNDLDKKIHLSK